MTGLQALERKAAEPACYPAKILGGLARCVHKTRRLDWVTSCRSQHAANDRGTSDNPRDRWTRLTDQLLVGQCPERDFAAIAGQTSQPNDHVGTWRVR